jgi:hypothetical protein
MRTLQFFGALILAGATLTLTAHAADKPPCSGEKKAEPDKEKDEGKPKDDEAAPKEDEGKPKVDDDKPKVDDDKKVEPEPEKTEPVVPIVKLSEPEFMGGEVKLVTKSLNKTLPLVAACVKGADGLDGTTGFFKVQFLVRDRGRAEGVEVLKRKGANKEAATCVRKMLKNRWVGTPSNDPVGVTFRYELTAPKN